MYFLLLIHILLIHIVHLPIFLLEALFVLPLQLHTQFESSALEKLNSFLL